VDGPLADEGVPQLRGHEGPRGEVFGAAGQRPAIYFALATLDAVLRSADPLYIVEVQKKALSVAQLGLPTIGICGIEGWHVAGAHELHPDLDDVGLLRKREAASPADHS
jgi:hypothetical protein